MKRRNLLDPIPDPEGDGFPDLDDLAEAIENEANISSDDEGENDDGEDAD